MGLFKKYKFIIISILFVIALLGIGLLVVNMVTNKSVEGSNNNNKNSGKDSKTLYYFMMNNCGHCIKFSENPDGWPAVQSYIKKNKHALKVKRIDINNRPSDINKYENDYIDNKISTVPHINVYNHTKQKWEESYNGNRDRVSLQKYVNKQ